MNASRWLLPFTHRVDMGAINLVVDLAKRAGATLIAVSLISKPHTQNSRGVRLEHIQQSKDFLEAVHWKAERYLVPVERYEVFTVDRMQSITTLVADLHCDAIILVTTGEREVFLQMHELKHLLERPPCPLQIIRMSIPGENGQPRSGFRRFLSWLPRFSVSEDLKPGISLRQPDIPEAMEPF